ncbi:MAG: hypothetical protein ACQEP1_02625 [Nanobdellota archaeon]
MDFLLFISEALRMFRRARKVKREGLKAYEGSDEDICRQIIEDCWNKDRQYFMTSTGNYPEFYCRDFSWVTESLINLGHRKRVRKTLEYALSRFREKGRITTTISPGGKCFDFPKYAPDSLASILLSLKVLGDKKIVSSYKHFLESEVQRFYEKVIDDETGLPKPGHFSSMKDYSIRDRSCYDATMCYLVKVCAEKLGLRNPIKFDYRKLILENYWNGSYFLDDLSGRDYVAGDAQVWPFWTGIFSDKAMKRKVIDTLMEHRLDTPLPLKYTSEDNEEVDMILIELFARDWEKHVCWTHMGPLYIKMVKSVRPALAGKYIEIYKTYIEKYKNYVEVFEPDGNPYGSFFYYASDSMIWAANYLDLK